MTGSIQYSRAPDVIATEVDGAALLLNTQTWVYVSLDPIGTVIWDLLESPATLDSLVDRLTERYAVSREQCATDTRQFLEEIAAQGNITKAGS